MMTVLRLHWRTVDERRWSVVTSMLTRELLAPHGCLSWHSRPVETGVRVTALWDDHHGAQRFAEGRLVDVLAAAGLDSPEVTRSPVRGLHFTGQRPAQPSAA